MDVELVRWPSERRRRQDLATRSVPRLLLVEETADPPTCGDLLEDWVRTPASDVDLRARIDGLRLRADQLQPRRPELDRDGVLRVGDDWVSLPPVEARLTRALLDRFGTVVSRETLSRVGWPDRSPGRNALDVHVLRLRRRIADLGLAIRTVRARGYLLEGSGGSESVQTAVPVT